MIKKAFAYREAAPSVNKEEKKAAFDRSKNTVLNENGLDVLLVRNFDDLRVPTLAAYDAIILQYQDVERVYELLKAVRSSSFEEIYLKPCFILAYEAHVDPVVEQLSDGVLTEPSILSHFAKTENILEAMAEIADVKTDFTGRKLLLKLMRYLYSRQSPLVPVPSKRSHTGYAFPFLEANVKNYEYEEIFHLLEAGVQRGFLSEDFVDVMHLCSNCNSGFINYREVCPKCNTRKLTAQNTIHHFVCGNVGPESDYKENGKLVCPKCDRQLRHIGVDYDKPSLVVECENGHIFQEPNMETFCFNCHSVGQIEDIVEQPANEYHLTASGAETALSGKAKVKEEKKLADGFVSLPVFRTFLKLEIERLKLNDIHTTVSYISLLLSPATLKKHEDNYEDFRNDLGTLLVEQLKPSEIATMLDDDVFLVISPEGEEEPTKQRFKEICERITGVLVNSLDGNKADRVAYGSFEVEADNESDSVMMQINEKLKVF
ncbi:TackOD1 domain-containing metal-binding protein [Roseivirga pacifica]